MDIPPLPREYIPGPDVPREEFHAMLLEQQAVLDKMRIVPMKSSATGASKRAVGAALQSRSFMEDATIPQGGSALQQSLKLTLSIAKRYVGRYIKFTAEEERLAEELFSIIGRRPLWSQQDDQRHPQQPTAVSLESSMLGKSQSQKANQRSNGARKGLRLVQAVAVAPTLFRKMESANVARNVYTSVAKYLARSPLTSGDVVPVVRHIMKEVMMSLSVANCVFYIRNDDVTKPGTYLLYDITRDVPSVATLDRDGPHLYVLTTQQCLNFTSASAPKSFPEYRGSVICPVETASECIGVCHVTMKSNNSMFSDDDLRTLSTMSDLVASAITTTRHDTAMQMDIKRLREQIEFVKKSVVRLYSDDDVKTAAEGMCRALCPVASSCTLEVHVPSGQEEKQSAHTPSVEVQTTASHHNQKTVPVPNVGPGGGIAGLLHVTMETEDPPMVHALEDSAVLVGSLLHANRSHMFALDQYKQLLSGFDMMEDIASEVPHEIDRVRVQVARGFISLSRCSHVVMFEYSSETRQWVSVGLEEEIAVSHSDAVFRAAVAATEGKPDPEVVEVDVSTRWCQTLNDICGMSMSSAVVIPLKGTRATPRDMALLVDPEHGMQLPNVIAFARFAARVLPNARLARNMYEGVQKARRLLLGDKIKPDQRRSVRYTVDGGAHERISGIVLDARHKEAMLHKEFNMFMYWGASRADWLIPMTLKLCAQFNVLKLGSCTEHTFVSFMYTLRHLYRPLPYTNFFRAVDTAHTMILLLYEAQFQECIQPFEGFGLIVAAFLFALASEGLAGDEFSRLEDEIHMRTTVPGERQINAATMAFELLSNPETNVLSGLTADMGHQIYRVVTDALMACDLRRFPVTRQKYVAVCSVGEDGASTQFNRRLAKHRKLVHQMLMVAATTAHAAMISEVSRMWAVMMEDEVRGEVMKEKMAADTEIPAAVLRACAPRQAVLLEEVVVPCLTALNLQSVGVRWWSDNADMNLKFWRSLAPKMTVVVEEENRADERSSTPENVEI